MPQTDHFQPGILIVFVFQRVSSHSQFLPKALTQPAQEADFVHRYRPERNGIAGRFALTLKDRLRSKSSDVVDGLVALLAEFQPKCNDHPDQGLAPGIIAQRISQTHLAHVILLIFKMILTKIE